MGSETNEDEEIVGDYRSMSTELAPATNTSDTQQMNTPAVERNAKKPRQTSASRSRSRSRSRSHSHSRSRSNSNSARANSKNNHLKPLERKRPQVKRRTKDSATCRHHRTDRGKNKAIFDASSQRTKHDNSPYAMSDYATFSDQLGPSGPHSSSTHGCAVGMSSPEETVVRKLATDMLEQAEGKRYTDMRLR